MNEHAGSAVTRLVDVCEARRVAMIFGWGLIRMIRQILIPGVHRPGCALKFVTLRPIKLVVIDMFVVEFLLS